MKKAGLLLILLISIIGNSSAQAPEAYYKLTVSGYAGNEGDRCGSMWGLEYINVIYTDNSEVSYFAPRTLKGSSYDAPTWKFKEGDKKIKQLHFHTNKRHSTMFDCSSDRKNGYVTITGNCYFRDYNFSEFGSKISGYAHIKIIPEIKLKQETGTAQLFGDADPLVIDPIIGVHSDFYNWQYYDYDLGDWEDLPLQFQKKNYLTIKGAEFLPESHYNRTIRIRVNINNCTGTTVTSNEVTYTYLRSAPHIQATTYQSPVCHGENNGEIHIRFNRALYDKENLYFARKNTITNLYDITDILDIDPVTKIGVVQGVEAGFYDYRLYGSHRIGTLVSDTVNTYTDGVNHFDTITVIERPKVVYTISQDSVHCHAGADGSIRVNATGGIGQYYAALFSANNSDTLQTKIFYGTTRFENLKKGDYTVYLKDLYDCEPQSPDSIYQRISVKEPARPLQTHNTSYQEPKAFGYSDGIIWSYISGGTGAYDVIWRDSIGTVVKHETLIRPTASSSIRTEATGIKKGTYYLYVKDRNHGTAAPPTYENYCGCEALDSIFVDEPPKLLVAIDTLHYVTCNDDADGQLKAHAIGGRPDHTRAMPYTYEWHRITADSTTVLESYTTVNDSILTNLASDHYVICVTDTNNIKAYSPIFHLTQPDPLVVTTHVIRNLSCNGDNNGEIEVIVTGGTKPYSYFWETGDTTRVISGLSKGIYSVFVRDARYTDNQKDPVWYTHYCQQEASGEITSPNGMSISSVLTHPVCNSYSNGKIDLSVSGGVAPYTYLWNDGTTTLNRSDLSDGHYTITVTDANGCNFTESYVLQEPEPLIVYIGDDFTLCKDQSVSIDGGIGLTGISYLWTDGNNNTLSTDSVYAIDKAGQYRLLVTNQAGCTAFSQINVAQSNIELVTDFVVASKIPNNTKVNAVNIIRTGYDNIEWIVPDQAVVLEENRDKLQFSIPVNGYYTIGMIATRGQCRDIMYKTIEVVNKGDIEWTEVDDEPFLKTFIVYPNPNDGNFRAKVELREAVDYSLTLYDTNGVQIESKMIRNSSGEETIFNQIHVATGTYYLRFVSKKTTSVYKIIINK
ncbi:T9SS type A sorting domain-containing protein [Bacteroides reticulotermitis]|uniref:T9SS type A sorting domain-containing protein n=1 Tax=Bacteroides reticulotermitis TaxID=1133319 RepID=UPI003A8721AE